jgi:hypothetical protein
MNDHYRDIPFQSDFEFLSYLKTLTDSANIIYFNAGSKLKNTREMATEVALPDITKYPTFNVNNDLFTLVGHGKIDHNFIRCLPLNTQDTSQDLFLDLPSYFAERGR